MKKYILWSGLFTVPFLLNAQGLTVLQPEIPTKVPFAKPFGTTGARFRSNGICNYTCRT